MTAFDRFDKFKTERENIFPGQDSLRNHILDKADVIYVDDPSDFSVLKDCNATTRFVWLVAKDIDIYPSFPWYYQPKKLAITKFPYVFHKSRKIKSYNKVILVPNDAHEIEYESIEEKYICGHYDPYKGKDRFDIFYIGKDKQSLNRLTKRDLDVQVVESFAQAKEQCFTDMFWIVYDDTMVRSTFKFSYSPMF